MADQQRTAQDLIRDLRRKGISTAEIAEELHRSPRMVRKILNGETSGALYRQALQELADTGRLTHVPPRRRRKDGSIAPVRGKAGAKPVIPEDLSGTYVEGRQGGRLRVDVAYATGGDRYIEMRIPKGRTAKGREQANAELIKQVRNAAKGQSHDKQKQITAHLTFSNGRVMEVNSYNASTMLKRIHENGGDALGWFREESKNRYVNLDTSRDTITGVTLNVVSTAKTTEYQRQAERGRTHRPRSLSPAELISMEEKRRIEERRARRRGNRGGGQ
ncbi:MAG TPA: hypothetical protein DEA69_09035 [Microbacterium sp.]|uniref:hypothetical protein n=1 Tax=Microbacterium TaxID=33882 RepID=UPI0002588B28|nr:MULTISPECIES: hypothetical protein [unclassified Microbacterium]EIC07808.1 hypothetical protein OR221_2129 [Microbacterium laevaniformans OR221]HBS08931.1 hypothetical protein [Microbacterium sp.]|tara:strand:+ start:7809 stop:8633 length:825 start_codon:yes stop_codon:yes gene_type:complete